MEFLLVWVHERGVIIRLKRYIYLTQSLQFLSRLHTQSSAHDAYFQNPLGEQDAYPMFTLLLQAVLPVLGQNADEQLPATVIAGVQDFDNTSALLL
jgi:hypothetical protein